MPNFPIPRLLREHIRERACHHANKVRELALTGFPLSVAQVQDAVLDPETQGELRALENKGVRTIAKYREIRLAFLREKVPTMRRGIVVKLELPTSIYVKRATHFGIGTTGFEMEENHYLTPDLGVLDGEARETLLTWLGRALREERLYEIVTHIVGTIMFEGTTPTMGHLHAVWPLMATLVDPHRFPMQDDQKKFSTWREKLRNPPVRMSRYQPSGLMMSRYAPLIKAAEVQITTGMMLGPITRKRSEAASEIEHWERIKGDIKFPEALQF